VGQPETAEEAADVEAELGKELELELIKELELDELEVEDIELLSPPEGSPPVSR
jgi:hypothetical protein